jgi:peptide/nickel transport system permease protein
MGRFKFVYRRLIHVAPLLLGISILGFVMLQMFPGDPALSMAGPNATDERIEAVRDELGLDDPLPLQYVAFVGNLIRFDLGDSLRLNMPVTQVIADRAVVTGWLLGVGTLLAILLTLPLATIAAHYRERAPDHAVRAVSMATLTMPPFWVGLMLLLFVALRFDIFPTSGFGDTFSERLRSIFLPALTMALALAPVLIRSMRASMIRVLNSDYVAAARAAGFHGRRLVVGHVFRNASASMITLLAAFLGYMLFGVIVIEHTFTLPGLGSAMQAAVGGRDYPVIMGITLLFAVAVVVFNLIADILHAAFDPRVEME